jgi:hypothetical protein
MKVLINYIYIYILAELSEIDESFLRYNSRRNSEIMLNNSYKIVNEKIIKLKKFEFDFANMMELIKNYLVVQEIIIKNMFVDSANEVNFFYIKNLDHKFRCF